MDRPTFPGQRLFAHPAFQTVNGLFLTGFFGLAVLGAVNRERWLMSVVYDALVFAGLWLIGVARFGRTQRERQDEMWDRLLLDSNDTRRQRLESFRQVRREQRAQVPAFERRWRRAVLAVSVVMALALYGVAVVIYKTRSH